MSITEIAFLTGWSSLGTFGRTFHDIAGKSPSELRADEKRAPQRLDQVPACILRGALRPDLRIAVSEKRRLAARGSKKGP